MNTVDERKRASHTLGQLIRRHRLQSGLTQEQLADRAEVSIRTLRDVEGDRVPRPRIRSVQALATALGLSDADRDELLSTVPPGVAPPPDTGRLFIGVLGPLTVRRGAAAVHVGSALQRRLLALLALHPHRVVARDEIVDVLWGDQPPRTCVSLLHGYVAQLRGLLEPDRARRGSVRALVLSGGGYRLEPDDDQLDVLRFTELAATARRATGAPVLELSAQALACWRGPAVADLGDALRQHPTVVALARERLAVALTYADLADGRTDHERAAAQLRELARDEPLHEGLSARLMLALAGSGDQAGALRIFAELRTRLDEELGVEPGAEVQAAHLTILRCAAPAPTRPAAPARDPDVPAQLPTDVGAFTGRSDHLRALDDLVAADGQPAAVVVSTIGGTAGVGKTSLAVHWAHRARGRFPDGQLYVNLQGWSPGPPLRPIEALARFLRSLGVAGERVPMAEDEAAALYRTLLADRRMLVLLDNAHSAEQVRPLLPGSPGCLVLVTGRDRLAGLTVREGAHRITLGVLSRDEALTLLTRVLGADRVAAEPRAAGDLVDACARLPLALRIAAANLLGNPGQTIADYLADLTADGLAGLAVEGDGESAIRAAFDLSYQRLAADDRALFRLLGLVPGPDVTADAAAALAGVTQRSARRALDRLAGAHLLDQQTSGRFASHDLLRQYATERTHAEDDAARRTAALGRLLDWYLHTAGAAAELVCPAILRLPVPPRGPDVPAAAFEDHAGASDWLDAERPNLIAATRHAAEHGAPQVASRLAEALRGFFWLRQHTVDWLDTAQAGLAAAEADGDPWSRAAAHQNLGHVHRNLGRHPQAVEHLARSLVLSRQAGWRPGEANALAGLGIAHGHAGRLTLAADHLAEAMAINRQLGRRSSEADNLSCLGMVVRQLGRLHEAASTTPAPCDSAGRAAPASGRPRPPTTSAVPFGISDDSTSRCTTSSGR